MHTELEVLLVVYHIMLYSIRSIHVHIGLHVFTWELCLQHGQGIVRCGYMHYGWVRLCDLMQGRHILSYIVGSCQAVIFICGPRMPQEWMHGPNFGFKGSLSG